MHGRRGGCWTICTSARAAWCRWRVGGNDSNTLLKQTTPDIAMNKWGSFIVDEDGKNLIDGDPRWWRHRAWRHHGDPGHGRRPPRRRGDQQAPRRSPGAGRVTLPLSVRRPPGPRTMAPVTKPRCLHRQMAVHPPVCARIPPPSGRRGPPRSRIDACDAYLHGQSRVCPRN
jgi:hypothetical protein